MKSFVIITLILLVNINMVGAAEMRRADARTAQEIRASFDTFRTKGVLPRSFLSSSKEIAAILASPQPLEDARAQAEIARAGIIIYDMAAACIALISADAQGNKPVIEEILRALTNPALRSNNDYVYSTGKREDESYEMRKIPSGQGYFFKVVQSSGTTQDAQYLPITGENAWVGMALAHIAKTYPELSGQALPIMRQLAHAMLALSEEKTGLIVMAPKQYQYNSREELNYTYMHIDYNQEISVENNISASSFLSLLAQILGEQEGKQYHEAAEKIFNSLQQLYNKEEGYFPQGINTLTRHIHMRPFASDCQTWMIAAFGAEKLNKYHQDPLFSYKILLKTLDKAGIADNTGGYAGISFSDRESMKGRELISHEWTGGFILALDEVLKTLASASPEYSILLNIKISMTAFREVRKAAHGGQLAYAETLYREGGRTRYVQEVVEIPFGWFTTPGKSLASEAWRWLDMLGVNPFVLAQAAE